LGLLVGVSLLVSMIVSPWARCVPGFWVHASPAGLDHLPSRSGSGRCGAGRRVLLFWCGGVVCRCVDPRVGRRAGGRLEGGWRIAGGFPLISGIRLTRVWRIAGGRLEARWRRAGGVAPLVLRLEGLAGRPVSPTPPLAKGGPSGPLLAPHLLLIGPPAKVHQDSLAGPWCFETGSDHRPPGSIAREPWCSAMRVFVLHEGQSSGRRNRGTRCRETALTTGWPTHAGRRGPGDEKRSAMPLEQSTKSRRSGQDIRTAASGRPWTPPRGSSRPARSTIP